MKTFYKEPRDLTKLPLDRNENLNAHLKSHVDSFLSKMSGNCNLYPDNLLQLNKNISNYLGIPSSEIILTNGSEEALSLIFNIVSKNYRTVVKWEPTFSLIDLYVKRTNLIAINFNYILLNQKFHFNLKSINCLTSEKHIFYISSPNSPTGSIFCKTKLISLLNKFSTSLFILDGAYVDYDIDYYLSLYKRYPNIILVRTFSKSWGMAGLRAGYFVTKNPSLQNVRPNYAPNVIAATIANKLFSQSLIVSSSINETLSIKDTLEEFLNKQELRFIRGAGNFILIESTQLDLSQFSKRILYKTMEILDSSYIKISIPDKSQLDAVCESISQSTLTV